ncbi:MAG: dihydroorotate dehydrogenase electron transfer subunit [Candidatus Ratteibacteria bacterium]
MIHTTLSLIEKEAMGEGFYLFETTNPFQRKAPQPGQFLHIKIEGTLLRRPISLAGATEERLRLFFAVKGKGTSLLAQTKQGDTLDVIGPLGRPFSFYDYDNILLAAGGVGIGPILFLAETALKQKKKFTLLYGAKKSSELFQKILPEGKYEKILCTDDGSTGKKGTVPYLISLYSADKPYTAIYASGPYFMLKEIADLSLKTGIPAYVALETRMFCGMGVCQGCVVASNDGYQRVCKDGPVFPVSALSWPEDPWI